MQLNKTNFCAWIAGGILMLVAAVPNGMAQSEPTPGVKLQLPGVALVLKPVFLGIDSDAPIATRQVTLGNREELVFREWLTRSSLAGSFRGNLGGKEDWLYYLSETEITEAQWAAIMGGAPTDSKLPKTSVTYAEVQLFIEKLNAWTLQHAPAGFPKNEGQASFFRLPTEAEWEFAARGGTFVDEEVFNAPCPCLAEELQEHEWCFENSNGKIRPCGVLKPNPLGLHDMIGNAAEIVAGSYSFEYQQGRQGGFIVRGARFNEPLRQFRASRRAEGVLAFDEHGTPRRDPEVGFRLTLASAIFGNGVELETAWADFVKTRPMAAPVARESNARAVERELVDARQQADSLRSQLAEKVQDGIEKTDLTKQLARAEQEKRDLLNKVNLLSANLLNASAALQESEKLNAYSWVRTASLQSKWLYNSSVALEALRGLDLNDALKKRMADNQANLESAWTHYQLALRSMSMIELDVVIDAIGRMRTVLRDEKLPQQEALLSAIEDHLPLMRRMQMPSIERVIADFEKAVSAVSR